MQNRRHLIKIALAGGTLATAAQINLASAQESESTPAAGEHTRNKVFTNVLDHLPRAEDGQIAPVGFFVDHLNKRVYALIHNATEESFIMRQGWARGLDADGNILAEIVKVSDVAPYSYEADSYGIHSAVFEQDLEGVESLEFEFPIEPMEEATGRVENVSVVGFEPQSALVYATVLNDTDEAVDFIPTLGLFFDDAMNIVGGASNPGLRTDPGSESSVQMVLNGVATDRYLFAAFGTR